MDPGLHDHCLRVAKLILKGKVVPVLGAGANLCDRAPDESWTRGVNLPDGRELAKWLANDLECHIAGDEDLLRVSQLADATLGGGALYDSLRDLFNDERYPIPSLHRFLAELPGRAERAGLPCRHQLIVTSNYDNLLERALIDAEEPFDVVRYLATGKDAGRFTYEPNDGSGASQASASAEFRVIHHPKKSDVSPERRTVVLKIHGGFDHNDASHDSYVITEDDFIEYLTHTSPNELIPVHLLAKLMNSHLLFLGYAMRDWNLRVLLHRIWTDRSREFNAWAVQRHVEVLDKELWSKKGVELREMFLSEYVEELSACIDEEITKSVEQMRAVAGGAVS